MTRSTSGELTQLLADAAKGDNAAFDQVIPLVYRTLKSVASQQMASERPDHTLQATALVNECVLRLFGTRMPRQFAGRAQFYFAAAEAMRRILVDHARAKGRSKRGRTSRRVPMDIVEFAVKADDKQVLDLDEALRKLEQESPATARVVRLRFYAGLSVSEAADALGVSKRTVYREWEYARAWLVDALGPDWR